MRTARAGEAVLGALTRLRSRLRVTMRRDRREQRDEVGLVEVLGPSERGRVEARVADRRVGAARADFGAWIAAGVDGYVGRGLPGCDVSGLLVDWQIRDMLRASLRAVIATNEAMVDADFRDELRQLAVPALVVHGDRDLSAPFELTGRWTAALVPECEVVLYEHAPHGIYLTHRDRLTRDIAAFAGQVDGRAGSDRSTAA